MKHLTINVIKPNFEKKTNSMYYTVKKNYILRAIARVKLEVLSAIEMLSASTVKMLAVEQDRFLKKESRVRSSNFQKTASYKFLYWYDELRVSCKLLISS